jgi:glyoxylase I family protein
MVQFEQILNDILGGSSMQLNQIHHVAILASDYEKTKEFYVEKLGFQVIRDVYREDRDDYKIDLQLGDCELEVFVVKNAPQRPNYPEALGLRHLAFKVADIEEAVAWLNAKGIETEPVRFYIYTQNRMTFFKDPDGLPLEIHE